MWLRWNPEKTAVVRELWPTHSAAVIALKIGEMFGFRCSRNAVIGLVYRLNLKKGAGRHPPHEIKQQRPPRKMPPKPEWKPQQEYIGPPVRGIQCPCQVVDLEYYNCRWGYGDPREEGFYFCGAVTFPDKPYCPTHLKQAVGT